jgi:hypothetical protein
VIVGGDPITGKSKEKPRLTQCNRNLRFKTAAFPFDLVCNRARSARSLLGGRFRDIDVPSEEITMLQSMPSHPHHPNGHSASVARTPHLEALPLSPEDLAIRDAIGSVRFQEAVQDAVARAFFNDDSAIQVVGASDETMERVVASPLFAGALHTALVTAFYGNHGDIQVANSESEAVRAVTASDAFVEALRKLVDTKPSEIGSTEHRPQQNCQH